MAHIRLAIEVALLLAIGASLVVGREIHINLPHIRPDHDEHYLCMAHRLDWRQEEYIVGFTPNATANKVHHILMYGCQWPGRAERDTPHLVWDCGEMHTDDEGSQDTSGSYSQGPICAPGAEQSILYSWAMDAPPLELPEGVGFKIGGGTRVNYIVLQVHYGNTQLFARRPTLTDSSGVTLRTVPATDATITKQAGVLLLASYGRVLPGVTKHEISCLLEEDNKVVHPFRFRVHTHKLGVAVAGYKLTSSGNPLAIGDGNPQQPQMFYPVRGDMTLAKGDMVYAYCQYNNTMGRTINIGSTAQDEMCNFYVMYWTEARETLRQKICTQQNPTFYF